MTKRLTMVDIEKLNLSRVKSQKDLDLLALILDNYLTDSQYVALTFDEIIEASIFKKVSDSELRDLIGDSLTSLMGISSEYKSKRKFKGVPFISAFIVDDEKRRVDIEINCKFDEFIASLAHEESNDLLDN